MKRWLSLVVLAVVGVICGAAIGIINTAFVPNCGEECVGERLGKATLWSLALLLAFPAIGQFLFKRTGEGLKKTVIIVGGLCVASLTPFATMYGYGLHQRYWSTAWRSNLPSVDFSMMAIATKPVTAIDYGTTSKVAINTWERCALGVTTCDRQPRTVEAICLGSGTTVLIEESDWTAFRRIPNEDLAGISGQPTDMNLCSSK